MNNNKPSQANRVLDYINRFGSISTMEAFMDLGVTRLAARILELEHRGFNIDHTTETGINRLGEKTHYTRYSFANKEPA